MSAPVGRSLACLALSVSALTGACLQDAIVARGRDGASETDARERDAPDSARPDELRIEGEILANFERDNEATESEVRCALRLSRAAAAVSDAVVLLEASGVATTTLAVRDGQYVASLTGYQREYTLVVRTSDGERRATLVGPIAHRIEQPAYGAVLRAGAALTVRWSPTMAAEASVEASSFAETPVADTGSYVIPAASLAGEAGRVSEERLRVRRGAWVSVQGFSSDSRVHIVVSRDHRFSLDAR